MEEELIELVIAPEDLSYKRLDQFLADKVEILSRNVIKRLYEEDKIISPHTKLQLKRMPPVGTLIIIEIPEPEPLEAQAENIDLEILFEDEHLIVVNKPAGLVTHPAPGNLTGTLVNAILFHCPDLKGVGNAKRPGIVHRLDKGTSGVMVIAKDHQTHQGLIELFSEHNITRRYEALLVGKDLPSAGQLKSEMGRNPHNRLKMKANVPRGKKAITNFKVLQDFSPLYHVEFELHTGRTHQIRVHATELLNAALLNDELYGNPKQQWQRLSQDFVTVIQSYPHPFLHAKHLSFIHPLTKENLSFETSPPDIFKKALSFYVSN